MKKTQDNRYTIELHWRVYDDKTGEYFCVRPDPDGLDLVEISFQSNTKDNSGSVSLPYMYPGCARAVAEALLRVADQIEEEEKRKAQT